jgi:hypothetical protein
MDDLPVVPHAGDSPALDFGLVETFVELADVGIAVVGPLRSASLWWMWRQKPGRVLAAGRLKHRLALTAYLAVTWDEQPDISM